jgi:hypothetical protein
MKNTVEKHKKHSEYRYFKNKKFVSDWIRYRTKIGLLLIKKNKKTRYKNLKSALSGTRAAQCWMRTKAEQGTSTYRRLKFFQCSGSGSVSYVFGPPGYESFYQQAKNKDKN